MDKLKFHKVQYRYNKELYYLNFDFNISDFHKIKRRTRKFDFSETLLKFLSQNKDKELYITKTTFKEGGFEILGNDIFINIDEFQRFCFGLDPRIDRASAFFRQDVSIENINLIGATESQILEWIKELPKEKKEDFLSKLDTNGSIVDFDESELLSEIKRRKIGINNFYHLIESSKIKEIEEIGEKINLKRINNLTFTKLFNNNILTLS